MEIAPPLTGIGVNLLACVLLAGGEARLFTYVNICGDSAPSLNPSGYLCQIVGMALDSVRYPFIELRKKERGNLPVNL